MSVPYEAAELYTSSLFQKSRRYAETNFDRWYILSAKHGLVAPQTIVEPYDITLARATARERREWAERVFSAVEGQTHPEDQLTFLAGEKYREYLVPKLKQRGNEVVIPLQGMGIGRQLQWLTAHKAAMGSASEI